MISPKVIGVIGCGQLGRMLAIEATKMGVQVGFLAPEHNPVHPMSNIAAFDVIAGYDDEAAYNLLADKCSVITYEFENVAAAPLRKLKTPVRPSPDLLFITQNRLREKTFVSANKIPVTDFDGGIFNTEQELKDKLSAFGLPVIIKTADFGYDGKGQLKITALSENLKLDQFLALDVIFERVVEFDKEISVLVARSEKGEVIDWGVVENHHTNHILDYSICPARVSSIISTEAIKIAHKLATCLNLVGVMAVEMFVTKGGELLVNEIAPRPHNSGHLTIEGFNISQFGAQLRTVLGMPLISPSRTRPFAAMVNILGDLWKHGEPNWNEALKLPVSLHLYGKNDAKPGRKMGHITAIGDDAETVLEIVLKARKNLGIPLNK